MKLLALLTFTFLVGICQSSPRYRGEPLFSDYDYDNRTWTAEPNFLTMIAETELGKEIRNKTSASLDAIREYTRDLVLQLRIMFVLSSRAIAEEGERYASQVRSHVEEKIQTLTPQAEAYATDVQEKINETLQDIQKKTIVIVQDFHNQLTQSTGTIRKQTETSLEIMAQSLQSQISSFWESLTKRN